MERTLLIALCLSAFLLLAGCAGTQTALQKACTQEAKACPDGSYVGRNTSNNCEFNACPSYGNTGQIANPASVFCTQKGYKLEIRKGAGGGETGYCIFLNGAECEEWAFYRGECNETPGRPAGKEGEFCGGIAALPCSDGLECSLGAGYPDAGGKCVRKQPKFSACPDERSEACTADYSPVCGRSGATESLYSYRDYSNVCVACSKSSPATGYYSGTCKDSNMTGEPKDPSVLYSCPSERYGACPQVNDPVCGRIVDATSSLSYFRDYDSPCKACAAGSNAIAYYIGTCAGRKL